MTYIIETPDEKPRMRVDIDRFIADLRAELGSTAYIAHTLQTARVDEVFETTSTDSKIRFRDRPCELSFIAGGGMAAGPGRVWIACGLVDQHWLHGISVSAHRPIAAITDDVRKKLLDPFDEAHSR